MSRTLVAPEDSIEGLKLSGQARKPPRRRPLEELDSGPCFPWVLEHNVLGWVNKALPADCQVSGKILADSVIEFDVHLVCERAVFYTRSRKTLAATVTKGSGQHQTNAWAYSHHSALRIIYGHPETMNAIQRGLECAPLPSPTESK